MKTSNIIALVSLIIVIGGILVGIGIKAGRLEEKIDYLAVDVKDIKVMMIDHFITEGPEIAKIEEEKKDLESE